jgi:uncharacterized repeat protein (TIGR01451 family)
MQSLFLKVAVLLGVVGGSCAVVWKAHEGLKSAASQLDVDSFVAVAQEGAATEPESLLAAEPEPALALTEPPSFAPAAPEVLPESLPSEIPTTMAKAAEARTSEVKAAETPLAEPSLAESASPQKIPAEFDLPAQAEPEPRLAAADEAAARALPAFFSDLPEGQSEETIQQASATKTGAMPVGEPEMPAQSEPLAVTEKTVPAKTLPAQSEGMSAEDPFGLPAALPTPSASEPVLPQSERLTQAEPRSRSDSSESEAADPFALPSAPKSVAATSAETAKKSENIPWEVLPTEAPAQSENQSPPAMPGLTRLPPSEAGPLLLPLGEDRPEPPAQASVRDMKEPEIIPAAATVSHPETNRETDEVLPTVVPASGTMPAKEPNLFARTEKMSPAPAPVIPEPVVIPERTRALPAAAELPANDPFSLPAQTPEKLPVVKTPAAAAGDEAPWSVVGNQTAPQATPSAVSQAGLPFAASLPQPSSQKLALAPHELPPLPPMDSSVSSASAPRQAEILPEKESLKSSALSSLPPAPVSTVPVAPSMPAAVPSAPELSTSFPGNKPLIPAETPSTPPVVNAFGIPVPSQSAGQNQAAGQMAAAAGGMNTPAGNTGVTIVRPAAGVAPAREPEATSPLSPELKIEKIAPPEAVIGEPVIYAVIIRNVGGTAARDVVVEDRVPKGAQLEGTIPQAYLNDGKLSWQLGTLAPKEERKIQLKVIPLESGQIGSVATVSFAASVSSSIKVNAPQLSIAMTGPDEAVLGERVAYHFTLRNHGQGIANSVYLRAILPAGLTHPGGSDLEYEAGSLAPGAEKMIDLDVTPEQVGTFTPIAQVSNEGKTYGETRADIRIVKARLEISRVGPENRFVGRAAPCVTKITNTSTKPLTNITVQEKVAPEVELAAVPRGGRWDQRSRVVSWTIPQLEPGESRELNTLYVASAGGDHTGSVIAIDDANNRAEIETVLKVKGFSELIADVKAAQRMVVVGERVTLRLTLKNDGTEAARDVRTQFQFPAGFEFASAHGPTDYSVQERVVQFEPLPQVGMTEEKIYEIALVATVPGNSKISMSLTTSDYADPLVRDQAIRVLPNTP